jgi:hypothetical protein
MQSILTEGIDDMDSPPEADLRLFQNRYKSIICMDTCYSGSFLDTYLIGAFQYGKLLFLTKLLCTHNTSSFLFSGESVILI